MATMDDIISSGELDGYSEQAPATEGARIDRRVAATATCPACGSLGADYRPFTKPGSYRAFAVCRHCGHAHEF